MEPIINQEQFLPIIQKEPGREKKGGGGLFNSQWEIEGRERKAESDFIRKTDMKTTLENEIRKRRGEDRGMWDRLDGI